MENIGDVWTWTAIDADSKLIVSWLVADRSPPAARDFMHDVAARLKKRVQLTTDGCRPYLEAVYGAFDLDIDYSMLVKLYGSTGQSEKNIAPPSLAAKKNLDIRRAKRKTYIYQLRRKTKFN